MCYHISLRKNRRDVETSLNATYQDPESYEPVYHFDARQDVYNEDIPMKHLSIITQDNPKMIQFASWGLIGDNWPGTRREWFDDKNLTWNNQSERLFTSKLYSKHIRNNRCLILADGLFESHQVAGIKRKIPYYFQLTSQNIFAFAGMYSVLDDHPITPVISASIITRDALPFFKEIHNQPNYDGKYRMPTILDPKNYTSWLSSDLSIEDIKILSSDFTKEEFSNHPVSREINNTRIDSNRENILQKISYPELNKQGTLF